MRSWRGWMVCLLLPLAARCEPAPPGAVHGAGVEIRVEPFMALHSWVRQLAEAKGEPPATPGLAEAVAAVRKTQTALGGPQGWGIVDGVFDGTPNAAALAQAVPELPDKISLRFGGTFDLRGAVAEIAAAYKRLEPTFLAETWPGWKKELDREAEGLKATLVPKLPQVWADVGKHLDLAAPKEPIPVYLVHRAPFPGAVTFRSERGPLCVVSLVDQPKELHEEIVIHELLHGLDVLTKGESVLTRLRTRLEALPDASPRAVHDFVHTLMFAQAAGTTRAVFDPKHRDYGDLAGYYPKVPQATEAVVPAWQSYLKGEITRDAALDRIAQGFAATLPPKAKGGPKAAPKTADGGTK